MTISAVLWDMDGVLLDSERLVQQAFADIMLRDGVLDDPEHRYIENVGMNFESTVNWYLQFVPSRDVAEAYYHEVSALYHSRMASHLALKPSAKDALKAVQQMGIPQMVVTSTNHQQAVYKLELFSLMPFFEDVLGGDQVKKGKPHPEPYLTAAHHLDVNIQDCLVIEDSENGVKSGLVAGAQVIHVPDLIPTSQNWVYDLAGSLSSLAELPSWLTSKKPSA